MYVCVCITWPQQCGYLPSISYNTQAMCYFYIFSKGKADMNQETSIIQYTSMKMWRKCCQNYQKMLQFMPHWRGMKFDGHKFWVGYNLELLYFKTFNLL